MPPSLGPALVDPATKLLLVVAPDAGDITINTVIGLADARAEQGFPTVLADAAFDDPRLHQFLATPNLEGLADIFEFGASLPRVVTRPEGHSFAFVPSGAYVPDPRDVLGSQRWGRIAEELEVDQRAMLVFTLAGTPGLDELSRRIGLAVLVGPADQLAPAAAALDPECEIVAVVEPALPGEQDSEAFASPELSEPLVFRDEPEPHQRSPLRWVLLVLLAAALAWAGYSYLLAPGSRDAAVEEAPAATVPEPEPQPVETPIGYSVAVEAHQDLATAQERVGFLQRAEPGILFYLAPVVIGSGEIWYRVLAGPVTSREEGLALMERLIDSELKTEYQDWAVRPTEYAFLLGEYETSTEAGSRVVALAQQDIPAYIVTIRYEPGGLRYRVYGGAFENQAAAEVMKDMLDRAGIDAPLVERVGEPIAVDS